MQKGIRINESQLLYLASKARQENILNGYLYKKSADTGKWQLRWFALYQNLLFYYENENTPKPSGVALLEGCYCERLITPTLIKGGKDNDKQQYCFAVYYRKEGQRQYDLRAESEAQCTAWIDAIRQASFSKVLEHKEQLEQKHLHLLQILDSERQAKWHYVQQTEELTTEVKKLKNELREYKKEQRISNEKIEEESEELRKIKKVQSFFRGWLCRRRWKQIVEEYIRSDHAESMRKRNSVVFGMVECEEEYVKQLSALVSVFLRPLRMAASSKKPPINHEDVNSIFLNSETLLFLHQIFLKGLMARMENWPTLVLGDLFDMLLPMLGIYQEYVRNHHYSLQVLAEYKQKPELNQLLRRYEEKAICEGRSLETFLTYPMHQIPRYIITIHELLAHTPHDHVERRSLEFAQSKLEELSQIMQDEVSETENIRKNLAIERMIVEGCDILLDVNQTFVRQGSLLQVSPEKGKSNRTRLSSFSTTFNKESKKEMVRQVFLFTNHMLLTTRASSGRLHLAKHYGKIPLIDCTLVEDSNSDIFYFDDETSSCDSNLSLASTASSSNLLSTTAGEKDKTDYNGLDFRIIIDTKSGPPVTITLVASTLQEKAAWCSDISQCVENAHYSDLISRQMSDQSLLIPGLTRNANPRVGSLSLERPVQLCIENLHYSDLLHTSMSDTSSVTMPQSVRYIHSTQICQSEDSFSRLPKSVSDYSLKSHGNMCTRLSKSSADQDPEFNRRKSDSSGRSSVKSGYSTLSIGSLSSSADETVSTVSGNRCRSISAQSIVSSGRESTFSSHRTSSLYSVSSREGSLVRRPRLLRPVRDDYLSCLIRRSDPKLFRDDVDIKFSRTLNSCKVPQIRHASVERLLDRLTDLRFLSIDFLNTFLLTYRVFTTGQTVLEALKRVYRNPEYGNLDSGISLASSTQEVAHRNSFDNEDLSSGSPPPSHVEFIGGLPPPDSKHLVKPQAEKMRRISTGSMKIEVGGERGQLDNSNSSGFRKYERQDSSDQSSTSSGGEPQSTTLLIPPKPKLAPIASCETLSETSEYPNDDTDSSDSLDTSPDDVAGPRSITLMTGSRQSSNSGNTVTCITLSGVTGDSSSDGLEPDQCNNTLCVPAGGAGGAAGVLGSSSETLTSGSLNSHTLSAATSSDTLVPATPRSSPHASPHTSPKKSASPLTLKFGFRSRKISAPPIKIPSSNQLDALALSPATSPKFRRAPSPARRATSPCTLNLGRAPSPVLTSSVRSPVTSPKLKRAPSPISYSYSSPNIITNLTKARTGKRGSAASDISESSFASPRSSLVLAEGSPPSAKAGTVVTSSRASKRRSSSTAATAAFAAATAGSANPKDHPKGINRYHSAGPGDLKPQNLNKKRESVISTAATMRVLNVLRHWVSKHSQDFESDPELKAAVKDLLEEMACNSSLLPAEHKAAASILRVLTKEDEAIKPKVDLGILLTPPSLPSKDSFDTLSALDIAEQLTYLDHLIFMDIRSEELLGQAWMKPDKADRAQHVLLVSKRFNEVSRLVVSEIIRRQNLPDRVSCIEKWAAIADICRCMHNYNGVLQICAAFVNSSVYRLKKTWEKISKQTKQVIERLQTLVSSDGRFKNMRDALHRCDPPCIPYLGMYLTDLSFIEEGTPNVTEDHLVNFSKMRMIAHVIREIQLFQQTPYRIEHHRRVTNYLLDPSRLLDEEETYKASLEIEPRLARVSVTEKTTT